MSASLPWWREPTRAQWTSFLAAWLGWVLDAFDFTVFLLAMPYIAQEFGVTLTSTAGSITLTLLVRLLGGLLAGAAADRWGRRLPLMLSIAWFSLCDLGVYFAPSFLWILVLRTLFGLGMGAEWTAGATLAMENWPARSRGIASGLLQGGYPVGYLLAGLVSAWVIPAYGWRALFLIAAAPMLLILPIRFWVPESPEWQAARSAPTVEAAPSGWLAGLARPLLWSCALMTLGFSINFGLTGVYPAMLAREFGFVPQQTGALVSLFNVGTLLGTAVCGFIAARRGVASAIAFSAVGLLVALPFYTGVRPEWLQGGAFLAGALGLGFAGVVPMLLHSLFPAAVRARAVGAVYHVGAFAAAFVPLGVAALADHGGWTLSLSIRVVCGGSAALLVLLLPLRSREVTSPAA